MYNEMIKGLEIEAASRVHLEQRNPTYVAWVDATRAYWIAMRDIHATTSESMDKILGTLEETRNAWMATI